MDSEQSSDDDSESDFSIAMSDIDNKEFDLDTSEKFDPGGVTSGDDEGGCCHWSKEQDNMSQYEIIPDKYIPGNGHLLELLDNDTKPHDVLEKIMDDTFILSCIETTNEHGANDKQNKRNYNQRERHLSRHLFCEWLFCNKVARKVIEIPTDEMGLE